MITSILQDKAIRLYLLLSGIFITNTILAEMIGGKIFSLEKTLGLPAFHWSILGQSGTLNFSAGILNWPIVFIFTDIINEYYGKRGVRYLSFLTAGLILYGFVVLYGSIQLAPADFWITFNEKNGVPDMQAAFNAIYGQGMWIIFASVTAFLTGQILDVTIFQHIKRITGENRIWLRATGSTLISQLIDTCIVGYIAFVIGPPKWSLERFFSITLVSYSYKALIALVMTPVLYLIHAWIERYLGHELAEKMRKDAMSKAND